MPSPKVSAKITQALSASGNKQVDSPIVPSAIVNTRPSSNTAVASPFEIPFDTDHAWSERTVDVCAMRSMRRLFASTTISLESLEPWQVHKSIVSAHKDARVAQYRQERNCRIGEAYGLRGRRRGQLGENALLGHPSRHRHDPSRQKLPHKPPVPLPHLEPTARETNARITFRQFAWLHQN